MRTIAASAVVAAALVGCGDEGEPCERDPECDDGERCEDGACVPRGCEADVECPGSEACVAGACDAATLDVEGRFPSGLGPGFELVDLGEVPIVDGETPDLSFEIGPDVRGFMLVGVGKRGSFVQPLALTSPSGEPWVVDDVEVDDRTRSFFAGFPGPATSPNRALGRPRAAAALVPNTPALTLAPGTWTARFAAVRLAVDGSFEAEPEPTDGVMRVGVVKRLVDAPEAGTIDLALTFDPSSGLDAASAQLDAGVAQALARIDETLGQVGVRVGQVTYRDVAAPLATPVDLGESGCLGGDLEAVFDAEPAPEGALQLLFVSAFRCKSGAFEIGDRIAGISNGLPGLPFARRDGVLVSLSIRDAFPDEWATIIAHEVGHFLGLTHTEEAIAGIYDRIPDTVDARASDYLMYYDVSLASDARTVTPDQGWVVRQHPLVRPSAR